MSVSTKYIFATTILLLVALINDARAQAELPFGPGYFQNDLQMFAPLELDLNNAPRQDNYGYFFNYDKLFWSYSGEHVTMGDPNVNVLAERIYIQNPQDEGTLPEPYVIKNGLTDTQPNAGFAFGDRYEFGYQDGAYGWEIGILDGPDLFQTQTYGLGYVPPQDQDFIDNGGTEIGDGPRVFGFGSVHVNFSTPDGYLLGFRDYLNFLAGAITGTQVGPIVYVGNYGEVQEPDLDDDTIPFIRLTDDIDEDGVAGAGFIVDEEGNIILLFTDFDDLHEFNVAFDSVQVHNVTKTSGVEAMWTQVLTNQHYMAKHQNNHLEVAYGARFLRMYDQFNVTALGGIMGTSFWDTSFINQIVGPQVAMKWVNQRGRWTLTANTKFLFGYNIQDWNQEGGIGTEFIPGATNRPLYAQPTYFNHSLARQDFSPVAELRVEMAYHITQSVALKAAYNGMFVGNIRRAANSVRYNLPDMGYLDAGSQDLLVNGLSFGAEFGY